MDQEYPVETLDTSDPNDHEVIIKIDISNVFNTTCRVLTLDVLSDIRHYSTLTGMDRFTSRRSRRGDNRRTP